MWVGAARADTRRVDELRVVLDELDAWFAAERPDLYPRLRPGLSERQIEELEARLAPYRLPADLVTVYVWHDGWDDKRGGSCVPLVYDCTFNSLGDVIWLYEEQCELDRQLDNAWNPLWFPAFGYQTGEFVELQPDRDLPAGLLWSFHSHDGGVHTSYDSVAALFGTALELWRRGLLPLSPGQWPDVRRCLVSHNPVTRDPDGRWRLTRSAAPSFDWPEPWLKAAGIAFPRANDGDVITIAELLANPSCERPVRGVFRTALSSGGWETGTLSDDTGSAKVHLERDSTENFRLLRSSNRFEMILRPVTEGETVEEMADGCEFGSDLEESVTRRILDASSASFDAIRIVPLPR